MTQYVVLLRGINVGGKNKVPMAQLRAELEQLGFTNVRTYIASGNVLLTSRKSAKAVRAPIEAMLPERFSLDADLLLVHVLTGDELRAVHDERPRGFGAKPDTYHSDAIFLIDLDVDEALEVFSPREGVDEIWPGDGVIYSQRLSAQRTKSRLGRIVGTPAYRSMTIRSWKTVETLVELLERP